MLPFMGTWMDLESSMLIEISQKKTNIWSYIWNLKKIRQMHKQNTNP